MGQNSLTSLGSPKAMILPDCIIATLLYNWWVKMINIKQLETNAQQKRAHLHYE